MTGRTPANQRCHRGSIGSLAKCSIGMAAVIGLAACKTAGTSPDSTEYSLFFSPATHVNELLDENQHDEAAKVFEEQSAYFSDNTESDRQTGQRLVSALAVDLEPRATAATADLAGAKWPLDRSAWPSVKQRVADAQSVLDDAARYEIMSHSVYRPSWLDALDKSLSEFRSRLRETAAPLYASYPYDADPGFFEAYPETLSAKTFLADKRWRPELGGLSSKALARLHRDHGDALPDHMAERLGQAHYKAVLRETAGSASPSFAAMLRAIDSTTSLGMALSDSVDSRVVVIETSGLTGSKDYQTTVDLDLPFRSLRGHPKAIAEDPVAKNADVLVFVDLTAADASREIKGYDTVQSEYRSGTRRDPNPAYAVAKAAVYQAEINYRQKAISSTISSSGSCYGWGCLGKAIGQIGTAIAEADAKSNFEQAMANLQSTPPTIETPVYTSYTFRKATIDATKTSRIHYYVWDRAGQTYSKGAFQARRSKSFSVAYNVHQMERFPNKHLLGANEEAEVTKFEKSPISVNLSDVLGDFSQGRVAVAALPALSRVTKDLLAARRVATASKLAPDPVAAAKTTRDSRFESTVRIVTPAGSLGSGFYVTADSVVTNYHVIEGTEFVEIETHDGMETFGKVVATDIRLDLALIKVQARGRPVAFYKGDSLPLGSTVVAVGHPEGLDFSITRGIISAVRKHPSLYMDGGEPVLYIQTDTPLNHGNSGGPLFLGDKVVGVVDWGLQKDQTEGLNFAIHYHEVLGFLRRYGVAAPPVS